MPKASHIAAALVLTCTSAFAADPVPVIELQVEDSTATQSQGNYLNTPRGGSNNEMLNLLEQLQDEVRSLRGLVEQQQHQIQRMEQQQRDRYRDLDRRIGQVGSNPSLSGSAQSSGEASAVESQPLAPLPAADSTPTDTQAYQAAFALVRQKAYGDALEAFAKFIELYPDSARLPNAHYWVGEVNLAEQKLEPARLAFEHVLSSYPEHRKASDSSYKLGVIYHQLGNQDKADEMFKQTITRYPDSSAANLARDYLQR